MLPPDNHVHTEWSWDARAGSMARSCARAIAAGLAAIAFTEHFDITRWVVAPKLQATLRVHAHLVDKDDHLRPPPLDVGGYLECIERCREQYPQLRILTGVELGEPHWFDTPVQRVLAVGEFDRVLGSLHSIRVGGDAWIMDEAFADYGPDPLHPHDTVRAYLHEALRMVESPAAFQVLAHIDYPARHWPHRAGPFPLAALEDEHRAVLRALAGSGRALEVNTRLPLAPEVLRWWVEEGGEAVSFGSDAHAPAAVAHGFAAAAAMAEAHGFRRGRHPHDFWVRRG
ncbi:MAG: PHP domain-containing protein [Nitriliruptorales bacterium]|nr:PHP domain-containing protein [Nitriliruptorales bacterium]